MSMQTSGAKKRVYMDYSAASPVDERVLQDMMPYFSDSFGNPSSLHNAGREPKKAMEEARSRVASLLNAKRKEEVKATALEFFAGRLRYICETQGFIGDAMVFEGTITGMPV